MERLLCHVEVWMVQQAMSWEDGYACYSTSDIDMIANSSEADHPILIVLAHDGDNAFGGGYSYYEQCVSDLVKQAEGKVGSTTGLRHSIPVYGHATMHILLPVSVKQQTVALNASLHYVYLFSSDCSLPQ